eukprot:scaffold16349_cov146-Skeletonema_menzelii.AAC.6
MIPCEHRSSKQTSWTGQLEESDDALRANLAAVDATKDVPQCSKDCTMNHFSTVHILNKDILPFS